MLSPRLRRRLSELARTPAPPLPWTGTRGGACPTPEPDTPTLSTGPLPDPDPSSQSKIQNPKPKIDDTRLLLLPFDPAALGTDHETESGRCFHLSLAAAPHLDDATERADRLRAAALRLDIGPEALRVVDIETAGLTAAPLFLVGVLSLGPDGLTLTQYFARGYEEEAALLDAFSRSLASCRLVVTFNGATFDLPYLRDRSIYHRLPPPLFPDHLDMLPAARRRYRTLLPDCRLQTLEQHVCRRHRTGDIPGEAIPPLYHDFVRTGHWPLLHPIFHHNALDLLTLAELLPHLLDQ